MIMETAVIKQRNERMKSSGSVETVEVPPMDEHNRVLVENVHPPAWVNPQPAASYNLVVIGAGTAGLVTAAGAAGLGAKVALIERHLLGGDCLNVGCVPSKCVIRSATAYADVRDAGDFGIRVPPGVEVDFPAVMARMRKIRAGISHHDSAGRFRDLGVDVFLGQAAFKDPYTIEVGGRTLRFRKAVIAAGARAVDPPVPGLRDVGYLTNETVFNLTERPRRLAVIGGGPIGCELAQTFRRLGCEVTLIHNKGHLLDREDADAAEIVQEALRRDGLRLVLDARTERAERTRDGKVLHLTVNGKAETVVADEILAGAGRAPNVEGMNLEAAGVEYDRKTGVKVNDQLQTTQKHIFAAGDICMQWKFTHAADFAARIAIQNTLFLGRKKLSSLIMPWCTYTDPEIAHVGLYEREAAERGIAIDTYVRKFEEVDRALAEGEENGFVKIHTRKGTGRIVGATIVARAAGEMVSEITAAMVGGIGLGKLAATIHPYPTQAEAIRALGDMYNRTRLKPVVKKLLGAWLRWRR